MKKDDFLCKQSKPGCFIHMACCSSGLHSLLPHGPGTEGKECPVHSKMLSTTPSSMPKFLSRAVTVDAICAQNFTTTSKAPPAKLKHTI
jgi:hypothetical protein